MAKRKLSGQFIFNPAIGFTFEKIGFADSPCPTTPSLEKSFYPTPQSIAKKANLLCNGDHDWEPPNINLKEITSFKGPF